MSGDADGTVPEENGVSAGAPGDERGGEQDDDRDGRTLRARVDLLEAENRRLRRAYERQRRTEHRRAAAALVGVGAAALAGAAAFPSVREVLIVVAAIGVFGGVLTRYLTPERFVSASVGERVYEALAGNEASLAAELGLRSDRVYVPVGGPDTARLFVPERGDYDLPDAETLSGNTLVVTGSDAERGLSLTPTGAPLYREFERSAMGEPASVPGRLGDELAEGIVEAFELASSVTAAVDPEEGRASFEVVGGALGDGSDFDDPVASTLAVGLAVGLGVPVSVEVAPGEGSYTVTCRWDVDAVGGDEGSDEGTPENGGSSESASDGDVTDEDVGDAGPAAPGSERN
ncbi:hypothetical protein [Halobaculum roseum]|uniref:DUF7982 domain-containing protein n=1 Tax=Halobaculum roseum TaxID=2175149 RepID=A0ABD5MJW3_9EURY|nr:hypothetical protein [Halobaculum roseum]QZY03444.1 hypothetical protein K6T36_04545 [Halobaculum roseum]